MTGLANEVVAEAARSRKLAMVFARIVRKGEKEGESRERERENLRGYRTSEIQLFLERQGGKEGISWQWAAI